MKLTFSQGILKHNTDDGTILGNPNFLVKSVGGDKVDLRAPIVNGNGIGPLQLVYAHRDTHYLLTLSAGADIKAWGYGSASNHNGQFISGSGGGATSNEFWLWVELDRVTGEVKYGYTAVPPTSGATPPHASTPQNRANDQHWYDTVHRVMNVWRKMQAPPYGRWQETVRVFVAQYSFNSNFTSQSVNSPSFIGTQAGLVGVFKAGSLIFDNNGNPLLRTDNNNATVFFTTEDIFSAGLPTSSLFQIEGILVDAIGITPAAAYTMVYFNDFNEVLPLNGLNQDNVIFGMIEEPIGVSGQLIKVSLDGIITNSAWNWDKVGQQIFCDTTGQLVTYSIVDDQLPIAVALSPTQIVLRLPKLLLDTSIPVLTLDDLVNVNVPTPSDGDLLYYNATQNSWVGEQLNIVTNVGDLGDVVLASPLGDGDILQYDSISGIWKNGPAPTIAGSPIVNFDSTYLRLDATNDPITNTLEIIGNGSPAISLRLTGQILATDGGFGAPTYSFALSSDTGLYSPGTQQWALSAGTVKTIEATSSLVKSDILHEVLSLRFTDNNTDGNWWFVEENTSGWLTFVYDTTITASDSIVIVPLGSNEVTLRVKGAGSASTPAYSFVDFTSTGMGMTGTDYFFSLEGDIAGSFNNTTRTFRVDPTDAIVGGYENIMDNDNDVPNKKYVDDLFNSIAIGSPVPFLLLDTSNGPLTGTLTITPGGSPATALVANGDIEINSQIRGSNQSLEIPTYSWQEESDTGILHPELQTIAFSIKGEEAIRVVKKGGSPGPALPPGLPDDLGIDLYIKNDADGDSQMRIETDAGGYAAKLHLITANGSWIISNDSNTDDFDFKWEGIKKLTIDTNGILSVLGGSPGYEALVTNDNHIPNKRYVDNLIGQDLGEYTVAGLPSASSYPNYYALVTDFGSPNRVIVRSDGTNWRYIADEGPIVA